MARPHRISNYQADHARVHYNRGRASEYPCWKCWENDIVVLAENWATVHGESGEDIYADYVPLCRKCHASYDRATWGRGGGATGSRNSHAFFTENDIIELRPLLTHFSNVEIAAAFGISNQMVSNIRLGKSWRHV
jgi:hypothetical protein